MTDGEPRKEEVAEALQHLLAWPAIARSGQLGKFLDYIVQRKLAGDANSIKAYSIAVDVFGRPPDFDPQSDPIVRVQARRLRALIGQFYREDGADEDVRIALPTGRYVPEFVRRSEAGAVASVPCAGLWSHLRFWTDSGAGRRSYGIGGKRHLGMRAGQDRVAAFLSARGT